MQEYFAMANQFEKLSSVLTQINGLPELLTQNSDEPDSVIEMDSDWNNVDETVNGNFLNDNYDEG